MAADHSTSRFVVAKGCEGLGNRLLGLLTAILYSRLANRQLVVDWSDPLYSRTGENAFPLLFTAPASPLTPAELHGCSVTPRDWRGRLGATVDEQIDRLGGLNPKAQATRLSANPARLDDPEQVVVYWSRFERVHEMRRHFKGKFRHLATKSDSQVLRDLLRTEVLPHPEIAERVDRFRRREFSGEVVGVHVRNSDLRFSAPRVLRDVDRILARRPSCKIFLATDSIETLNQARQKYGADRLLATEKWFPAPGRPIHLSAEPERRLQTAREALVDLYLLGACDWLVADWRSTFAYVAYLLFEGPASRARNLDPGRFLPRHIGHQWGIRKLTLRHEMEKWKLGRGTDLSR